MRNIALLAAVLAASACSSESTPDARNSGSNVPAASTSAAAEGLPSAPATTPSAAPTTGADVLTLEGLGKLRIGEPLAAASGWGERGAQTSEGCRTVSSPEYPGVYAIVEDGVVRRISAGERSTVRLIEGIRAGSSEAAVRDAFPGFREEPHKYIGAPAKYLTAPGAERGDPAVRFEIGEDRTVSIVHVGTMPVLGYVEGCS